MALLFSHVRVSTPDGNEAEFLVSGIPRELEDFDYYTKFEDFIDSIEEDTEITVHAEDGQRVDWYIYHPTASDYNFITDVVEDYISMYAVQGYRFDSGMEMGGM